MWNGTMFVDLDWPLNASSLLSASAELLVFILCWTSEMSEVGGTYAKFWWIPMIPSFACSIVLYPTLKRWCRPCPLAGGEGACCPLPRTTPPLSAIDLDFRPFGLGPQWKVLGMPLWYMWPQCVPYPILHQLCYPKTLCWFRYVRHALPFPGFYNVSLRQLQMYDYAVCY